MPRTFELHSETPSSIEQFMSALQNEDYWRERLAVSDTGTATLDSLTVEDDGTVAVSTTFSLVRDRLPKLVRQLGRGDLQMVHTETWTPIADGRVRGEIRATVRGTPVSAVGSVLVSPRQNGSALDLGGTVEVKIPLIGGAVEGFIGTQLTSGVEDMQRFTTAWIAQHGYPESGELS